jgi:ADP-ribose pyrophosphatase YjhB (NUDIX family)
VKLKVRAVIWQDGKIAIVRERRVRKMRLTLPGGRVKESETVEDALVRELQEEVGVEVAIERLLYIAEVFAAHKLHEINLVFLVEVPDGLPDDVEMVAPLEIPEGEVMPPILAQIAMDAEDGWSETPRWLGNVFDSALALGP